MPLKMALLAGCSTAPEKADIVAHWDAVEIPAGQISIPLELHRKLLQIRAEHASWAYETGFARIGNATLEEKLRCGASLSMWWTSLLYERHPRMSPRLYEIYKLRCLELLCEEHGASSLVLAGGDRELGETLTEFCAAAGLEFAHLSPAPKSGKPTPLVARAYHFLPAPVRAVVRYAHWLFTVRRKLSYIGKRAGSEKTASGKKPAMIATYFPNIDLEAASRGRFHSRYWESLHNALNEQAEAEGGQFARWLFIRFPHPTLTLGQCIKLRNVFREKQEDGESFAYLEEYLASSDLWGAVRRWARLCAASLAMESEAGRLFHFKNSKMNFWRQAREDWAESFRGWRALERCLQNLAFERHARQNGPMRFNLFPLENCPWERMLTVAARTVPANGPVIGAQHSSIRPTDFRYFDDPATFTNPVCAAFQPDYFCGNGNSACGQWRAFGMPQERLRRVEALRYLYLAKRKEEIAVPPNPYNELPPYPGEPLSDTPQRKLLVLASFFPGETDRLCLVLAHAIRAGLFRNWAITIKPHPYLPVRERLRELLGQDAEKLRFADGSLALELVPGVTAFCANSTTAALEAALLGLPLMVMQASDDFDLCPIQDAPGLARISTLDELKATLPRLAPVPLPPGYLDLDRELPAWRELLGLNGRG